LKVNETETQDVLVRAIEKVGTLDLEDVFKQAVAEAIDQIRTELERPEQDAGKVKTIWQSIKRVAAPVATILQTAAAVKDMIG
jgi:hypothetical protein